MKIAFIVNSLQLGGLERVTVDIVNALDIPAIIICLKKSGPLAEELKSNIKVFELNKRAGNDLLLPFRMGAVLKDELVDIVHSNNWGTMLESVVAAKIAGISRIVHTQHGMERNDNEVKNVWKRYVRNLVRRFCSSRIARIIAVSKDVKSFVVTSWGVAEEKVVVVHNGGKPEKPKEASKIKKELDIENSLVVGTVGRLMAVKNYSCLIRAFQITLTRLKDQNLNLVLIGDGPERVALVELAESCGISQNVHFLGWRSDVNSLLQSFDIFTISSVSEGISMAIIEAMFSGLPVVATNVGGNPEIVDDNKTGILFENNNHKEMSDAICLMLQNRELRFSMGEEGRKRGCRLFHIDNVLDRYKEIYRNLV